ncbi:MAG: MutS-related protein [Vicinamibacterales bacterium]
MEVEAVLSMIRDSAKPAPHLFLFDELFRGTNAVERIAAAEAVLRELIARDTGFGPHLVLASTHDAELVDLLHDIYEACHFGDSLGPDGLAFDHRVKPGATTTRNAIALLRVYGAPETLVSRALRRAALLDRQRSALTPTGDQLIPTGSHFRLKAEDRVARFS